MFWLRFGSKVLYFAGKTHGSFADLLNHSGTFIAYGALACAKKAKSEKALANQMKISRCGKRLIDLSGSHYAKATAQIGKANVMLEGFISLLKCG